MIGTRVSHFIVLEKLGGGGAGEVFKAEDKRLKRIVALKFLKTELLEDDAARARFLREARSASMLDHPNICTVYEIDETPDGLVFIAMSLCEGGSLKNRLEHGPLPVEEALDVAIQVAKGLECAHGKGIMHRDIKPANIMLTADGTVKLADFGLARLADQEKITMTGSTLGTAAYMSPEQASGETTDERTDIWSLGVVLYEMLTGSLPFRSEYAASVLYLKFRPCGKTCLPVWKTSSIAAWRKTGRNGIRMQES